MSKNRSGSVSRNGRVTKNETVIVWGTIKIRVFLLNVPGGERRKRGREKMLLIQLIALFFLLLFIFSFFFQIKTTIVGFKFKQAESNGSRLAPAPYRDFMPCMVAEA